MSIPAHPAPAPQDSCGAESNGRKIRLSLMSGSISDTSGCTKVLNLKREMNLDGEINFPAIILREVKISHIGNTCFRWQIIFVEHWKDGLLQACGCHIYRALHLGIVEKAVHVRKRTTQRRPKQATPSHRSIIVTQGAGTVQLHGRGGCKGRRGEGLSGEHPLSNEAE